MNIIAAILVLSGLILPTASYAGYPPWRLEYLAAVVACILAGGVIGVATRYRLVAALVAGGFIALLADMHFAAPLATYGWMASGAVGIVALGFAVAGFHWSGSTLLVTASIAVSQIASGVAFRPQVAWTFETAKVPPSTRPAVVHILLDEHGAIDAIPDVAMNAAGRDALTERWKADGFKMFRRAYTADDITLVTLARIFNRPMEKPRDVVEWRPGPESYVITSAPLFVKLGEMRALDVEGMVYANFRQVAMTGGRVARFHQVDYPRALNGVDAARLPIGDRLRVAGARMFDWTVKAQESRVMTWIGNATGAYHKKGGILYIWRSAYGLAAKASLDQFGDRLARSGRRGTYYYGHFLLPHWPYVFAADCKPLPASAWRYNEVHELNGVDTLETRAERYRLYARQAACTQSVVSAMVKRIRQNPELADATIIVHGDHGSRLGLKDRSGLSTQGYDNEAYARDQRATLVAILGPAFDREDERRPVRLDHLLGALWDSDFSDFKAAFAHGAADAPGWPAN